jgi:NAD-dependent DNA ligase
MDLDRLIRQFLVHSFLYYQLDESIISDENYDRICVQLKDAIKGQDKYLYQNLIENSLGNEGSGFSIHRKNYPPEIISTAFHLLYQDKFSKQKSFKSFIQSYGYSIAA